MGRGETVTPTTGGQLQIEDTIPNKIKWQAVKWRRGEGYSFTSTHRYFDSFTSNFTLELLGRIFSPGIGPV